MRAALACCGLLLCALSAVIVGNTAAPQHNCGNKSKTCDEYCTLSDAFNMSRSEFYTFAIIGCEENFVKKMEKINNTSWCMWDTVKSHYNDFTVCTESIAECLLLPWPNKHVEQRFVEIHTLYFQDCPTEALRDPPPNVVFALVMTPICLIPAMVVLVVLKTKNGDRRS